MKSYAYLFVLLYLRLFEETFNFFIYRKIGISDVLILCSFIFLLSKNRFLLKKFSSMFKWFITFIITLLISGLIQNNFELSGGYIHYLRNIFMTLAGFIIGLSFYLDIKTRNKIIHVVKLLPLFILMFQLIKFNNLRIDVSGAYEISKFRDEDIGFFTWNNMSAVASLSLFLLFIPSIKRDFCDYILFFFSLYIILISISRTAFTTFIFFAIIYFLSNPFKRRITFFEIGVILLIIGLISYFWDRIVSFYNEQYKFFFLYKIQDYNQDLTEVRIQEIIIDQIKSWWISTQGVFFGTKDVWGHSLLVTMALKGGIFALFFGFFYNLSFFIIPKKYLVKKRYTILYISFMTATLAQQFVADYASTITYYSFIVYLMSGILFGSLSFVQISKK